MPPLISPTTSHDKIIRAMVKLQREQPFFSYIIMNFKISAAVDTKIPTAGVNKYGHFFYNDKFILSLEPLEIQGLLVHECMHIAKGDFFRIGKREVEIWNIASDAIINYILKQEGFTLPKCLILPNSSGDVEIAKKKYNVAGKTTEEFYEELLQNATAVVSYMCSGKTGSGKGNNTPGHGGFDVHLEGDDGGGDDEHTGEGDSAAASANAENKWKKIVVEAGTNARARGKMPGCAEGIISKILNPVIDWRSRILKFITNEIPVDYTNRMPSRKFYGTGVWSPRVLRENLEVFISVDASGSTAGDRQYFINEVAGILASYEQIKARLIFWDYVVHEENDFEITSHNRDELATIKIKGCDGGTNMSSYAEYCEEKNYKCRLHIILTDGEIESNPKVPEGNIIFVLSKHGTDRIIQKYGAVCRLTDVEDE